MTARAYRKPGWWQRAIANRLAPRLAPRRVATLSVRGRRSGQWRTVPVVVLEHDGQRYLLTPFGDTDWSRNLRAAGGGRLRQGRRVEDFAAVEVAPQQRGPLIEAYLRRFGRTPGVKAGLSSLLTRPTIPPSASSRSCDWHGDSQARGQGVPAGLQAGCLDVVSLPLAG
jgi:deazaflavin-dependent oxidoreductase (nitroreductase family)